MFIGIKNMRVKYLITAVHKKQITIWQHANFAALNLKQIKFFDSY